MQAGETRRQKSSAKLQAQKDTIVSKAVEAKEIAHAAVGHQSKNAQRRGRRDNRAAEKQMERERGAWQLGETAQGNAPTHPSKSSHPNGHSDSGEYIAPSSKINLIEEILDNDWNSNGKK
jgi:hypothetical protein